MLEMLILQSIEENLASKQKEALKALTEELEEKFKLQLEEKEKQVRDEMHKKVGRSFVFHQAICHTAFSVEMKEEFVTCYFHSLSHFLAYLVRLYWMNMKAISLASGFWVI